LHKKNSKNLFAKLAKNNLHYIKKIILKSPKIEKKEKNHHIKIIDTSIVLSMASK